MKKSIEAMQGSVDLRAQLAALSSEIEALRYSKAAAEGASERFVTLFSTVPLALMVVDDAGLVLEINARALALLRPLESDPPLNFLLPLLSANQAEQVSQGFINAQNAGTFELHELVFSGGSNGLITGDLQIAAVDHAADDQASFICAIIDQRPLLAQRQALQTSAQILKERNNDLLQSKNHLAAIINSSRDAIIGIDQQQCILVFNPAAASLFKHPADMAIGMPLNALLPQAAQQLSSTRIQQNTQLGEMSGLTRTGESVALDVSVSMQQQPDGSIVTLFVRDLTQQKILESHRATLEIQLRESQKMQAIGTMAGGIAHDFNNIIGAILGNVALARQDSEAQSGVAISLGEIDKAGRRARDLVRQILTFSRNEPPQRAAIQLPEVVHETMQLLKVSLLPNVELLASIDSLVPYVMADATQVEQALLNLCTNAMYAIGEKSGRVHIRLERCHSEESGAAEVKLSVSDTGGGIQPRIVERIFEPFFTTKPVGQGTGLGLSVVHGIMRAHEGRVEVLSTLGQGSEFCLYFPACELAPEATASAAPVLLQQHGAGQHVMYVDDDEALVFLVKRVLSRQGYQVQTFSDPKAALGALQNASVKIDLLVTDFNMPGYSGVELLRDAQRIRPELPVALASGYVTPQIEQDALQAGARALIHKPNDIDELCATVQRLLSQGHAAP
jgi:PAS domain S-box-containing protein